MHKASITNYFFMPAEIVIISKEAFEELNHKLDTLIRLYKGKQTESNDDLIDNNEFIKLMKISKGTAQNWRDKGLIRFTQIGRKVYYRMSDIKRFSEEYNFGFKI